MDAAIENTTVKDRTLRFADESGISGLPGLKPPTIVRRMIWTFVLTGCFAICTFQIIETVQDYYEYPTDTNVEIKYDSNAQFPAVTFCNLNAVRQSQASVISTDTAFKGLMFNLTSSSSFGSFIVKNTNYDDIYMSKQRTLIKIYESKVLTQNGSGHLLNDTLLECVYQGELCVGSNKSTVRFYGWQHPIYGNCFTAMSNVTTTSTLPGPSNGLTMTLFADSNEYIAALAPAVGFQIEIHPPDIVPFPDVGGYTISPGFSVSVGIRKQRIDRLPQPYGNCSQPDDSEKNPQRNAYRHYANYLGRTMMDYNHRACWKTCMQANLRFACDCVEATEMTFFIAAKEWSSSSACNFDNATQLACYTDFRKVNMSRCSTDCPQACNDVTYEQRVTTSLWPSDSYMSLMLPTWTSKQPKLQTVLQAPGVAKTDSGTSGSVQVNSSSQNPAGDAAVRVFMNNGAVRANLVQLTVYFQELNYQAVTESAAITITDLGSNIGGILGLWVGMCIVTVMHILEWLIDIAIITFSGKRKNEKAPDAAFTRRMTEISYTTAYK